MMTFLQIVPALLLLFMPGAWAYRICPGSKSVCPDDATCCPTGTPLVSSCISSKPGEEAVCCSDDGLGLTGCLHGYECRSNKTLVSIVDDDNSDSDTFQFHHLRGDNNKLESFDENNNNDIFYCHRVEIPNANDTKPKPEILPRYRLTPIAPNVLKQVYGLRLQNYDDSKDGASEIEHAAYFSQMGALDSYHPQDLQMHQRVRTIFIMVHGSGRTAEDYLYGAMSSLPNDQRNPTNSTILVISPWFLDPDDDKKNDFIDKPSASEGDYEEHNMDGNNVSRRHHHQHHGRRHGSSSIPVPLPPNTLRWIDFDPTMLTHTWRYGANAINSTWSSFDVIDKIIEKVVNDPVRFPSLKNVIVAGHSAGGQFVQRWALLSNSPVWNRPSDSRKPELMRFVNIRAIPANPRCFAMLNDRRWVHNNATNTSIFQRPDDTVIAHCPDYNQWIWGLEAGGNISAPYKDQAIAKAGGTAAIAYRYVAQRQVVYLSGGEDLEVFQDDCGSVIQGQTRLERSHHFWESLQAAYPTEMKTGFHSRLVVPGIPHDHTLMFQSPQGQKALFGRSDAEELIGDASTR